MKEYSDICDLQTDKGYECNQREGVEMFKNKRQIREKIMLAIVILVLVASGSIGTFGVVLAKKSTINAMEHTMVEAAHLAASTVSHTIVATEQLLTEIVSNDIVQSSQTSLQEKIDYMEMHAKNEGFYHVFLMDTNGYDSINGVDHSGEKYFTEAKAEQAYFSEPIIDAGGESAHLVVSVPVYIEGKLAYVAGFECSQSFLQDLVIEIKVGESEDADTYILGGSGVTVASSEYDLVLAQENLYEQILNGTVSEDDASLAVIEEAMVKGEQGVEEWNLDGVNYMQSYIPIENTDGWSIAVTADMGEFTRTVDIGSWIMIAFALFVAVVGIFVARWIGGAVGKPLMACAERLEKLSQGDLHTPVPMVHSQDEIKVLAKSMQILVERFNTIIGEVEDNIASVADGDLTHTSKQEHYPGDFLPIHENLLLLNERLNDIMHSFLMSSEQIASGAGQVAIGAHALASGATNQADAVEELAITINEISAHTREAASNTQSAKCQAEETERELSQSNQQMQEMLEVMHDISRHSTEIQQIIKVIDDITFQTNILALNAAVEAARAGSMGKGFAVVADEVRNLASKTAESSGNIVPLIEKSVHAAQRGMKLADDTASSLMGAVDMSRETAQTLVRVANAADMQTTAIGQIKESVDQISGVVQTNSATSEQFAASSEELSAQTDVMNELIGGFKLRNREF